MAFKNPHPPVMSKDPKPSDSDPSKIDPKTADTQQETTEEDFWDLDEDTTESEATASPPLPAKKGSKSSLRSQNPVERQIKIPPHNKAQDSSEDERKSPEPQKDKPVAKKKRRSTKKAAKKVTKKESVIVTEEKHDLGDIHDLDDLEDIEDIENIEDPKVSGEELEAKQAEPDSKTPAQTKKSDAKEKQSDAPKELPTEDLEKAEPFTISAFSKVEKISLITLVAVLLITGILCIIHFSNRVPTKPTIAEKIDFPVVGDRVVISATETYWREPESGENADIVRRGTKLIPEIILSIEGKKPAAIRIFFRNDQGEVIGDGITREISGKAKLKIPATAGFEDIGMHAAYRTGESPTWIVQIYEGPSTNASRNQFKKVLETEISTGLR